MNIEQDPRCPTCGITLTALHITDQDNPQVNIVVWICRNPDCPTNKETGHANTLDH